MASSPAQVSQVASDLATSMRLTATNVLLSVGLFDRIPLSQQERHHEDDIRQRHEQHGGDPKSWPVLQRMLRSLVSFGLLDCHQNAYRHTPASEAYLTDTETARLFRLVMVEGIGTSLHVQSWFQHGGYAQADQSTFNPSTVRAGTKDATFFDVLNSDPPRRQIFFEGLPALSNLDMHPFTNVFPFAQAWENRSPEVSPFLVDVGGSDGRFMAELMRVVPGIDPGALVVQDLKQPIEAARANPEINGVTLQEHDFMQPQPIVGAAYYHIRACLHDWDDDSATTILKQLAGSMRAHSRLLIADHLLPAEPSPGDAVGFSMDVWMMFFGGRERTVDDMGRIVRMAGLKQEKIYRQEHGTWAVIEASIVCV